MEPSEFFKDILPNRIAADPDRARAIGVVFVFKISGENGGEWTVDLTALNVSEGAEHGAQCVISISEENLTAILNKPSNGPIFLMQGKLKMSNTSLRDKLTMLWNWAL
jgi:hypothetical protein